MNQKKVSGNGSLGRKIPFQGDPNAPIVLPIKVESKGKTEVFLYSINPNGAKTNKKQKSE